MYKEKILPVILCGGTGTRLWPLSRAGYPKQYLSIKKNSQTFLQETVKRVIDTKIFESPFLICNEEHRFIVAEQMRDLRIKPTNILLEPFGKNTAPAATLTALKASENGNDPILLILPADHIIQNVDKFLKIISEAIKYCKEGKLVAFGINPERPETGYGYIESFEPLDINKIIGQPISRFIEKPNKLKAKQFLLDKRFSWNSGIFLFKASSFLKEIKEKCPNILQVCFDALSSGSVDLDFQRIEKKSFSLCENISIDSAIMEKTDLGFVFPLDVGWSDIGSWQSMWEVSEKDLKGNVISGNVVLKDIQNSYFRSENRLLVGIGLKDIVAVETNDAVFLSNKNDSHKVKEIVSDLKLKNFEEATQNKKVFRPWGYYFSVANGYKWQVKKIEVKPGASLSLQMHKHRAEHWIVVKGKALVKIGDDEVFLEENQSTFIPLGSKHKLSNIGKTSLILIEVQSGNYLGEDDIIRFQDDYGRN